ncbi:MAG: hypothetical protein NPIRA01_34690 [Nitrospirales bacterium]|nr:MAG: hypothetical protein NPIRA01_34690 [Nitrospirales bacterium]
MATLKKNPPRHKIRLGTIHADIWLVIPKKGHSFLTVSFSRSYKHGEQWKTGHSFQARELDALMDVTLEAKEWMRQHRLSKANAA